MTVASVGGELGTHGLIAFVFTSSRTLRALKDQEEEDSHLQHPANAPMPSAPSSPSSLSQRISSDTPLAQHTKTQRASLTLSQLDKHSEGAISARSLLGPKMRAAGFVDLPHSRVSQRTPSTSPHSRRTLPSALTAEPAPRNPPHFPPILFVKPSHIMTTPMWEYQNEMDSSLATTNGGRIRLESATSSIVGLGELGEYTPRPHAFSASSLSSTLPERSVLPSPSHLGSESSAPLPPAPSSTLLSAPPCPSFRVDEPDERGARSHPSDSRSRSRNRKVTEWSAGPDEHPSPVPCVSPRSHRSAKSRGSAATASPSRAIGGAIPPIAHPSYSTSSASSIVPEAPPDSTAVSSFGSSTAVSSSTSSSRPPNAVSHTSPSPRRQRRSPEKPAKAKTQDKSDVSAKPTPSFSTVRRLGYRRPYSFTELCDRSSFVWMSKSELFAPPAPIARPSNLSALAPSSSRPPVTAEAGEPLPLSPPPRPARHPRRHAKANGDTPSTQGRTHRIASAPLRSMPMLPSEPDSGLEMDSEKAKVRKLKRAAGNGEERSSVTYASINMGPKGASTLVTTVDVRGANTRDGSTGSYDAFFRSRVWSVTDGDVDSEKTRSGQYSWQSARGVGETGGPGFRTCLVGAIGDGQGENERAGNSRIGLRAKRPTSSGTQWVRAPNRSPRKGRWSLAYDVILRCVN